MANEMFTESNRLANFRITLNHDHILVVLK